MSRIRTVGDLIRALEDQDASAPLRVAHQPNWPLREVVGDVTTLGQTGYQEEHDPTDPHAAREDSVVWLVLSGHPSGDESPYAPRPLFENVW